MKNKLIGAVLMIIGIGLVWWAWSGKKDPIVMTFGTVLGLFSFLGGMGMTFPKTQKWQIG